MEEIEIRDHRQKDWLWIDRIFIDTQARQLKPSSVLVYIALARHSDEKQQSYPSISLLCEELNLARQTVLNGIDELEQSNIITVERSKNEKTKRQNPNLYTLLASKKWKKPEPSLKTRPRKAESNSRAKPSLNDEEKPSLSGRLEVKPYLSKAIKEKPKGESVKIDKRNPEIQKLWEHGLSVGYSDTKQNLQRYAIKRLLLKTTADKLCRAADFAASVKNERYSPKVNSWLDLEDKLPRLRDYVQNQQSKILNLNNV